jgi:ABC-2 type transport system ATP-binding protein
MDSANLQVNAIELSYGSTPVIADLSMTIKPGSLIGLIGPNGAGKTTLLLALSGQFRPARGSIAFGAMDIFRDNLAFKYHTGYVHENPFFYPYLTAAEYLTFIGHVKKVAAANLAAQVDRLLLSVGLAEERDKLAADLSLGMKKKLAIAAAFMGEPALLFLDEALNGIDIESAYGIKQMLKECAQGGAAVVLSTHVLEVIEKLCDRYVVLKSGRIIADVDAEAWKARGEPGEGGLEEYIISLLHRSGV